MQRVERVGKFFWLMVVSTLLIGCATTNTTTTQAPMSAAPMAQSERTPQTSASDTSVQTTPLQTSVPSSTIDAAPGFDVAPPPAVLEANNETQLSGIGTYCWQEKNKGVCADAIGVPTSPTPLQVTSPVTVNLRLPLDAAPSQLQWQVEPVTDMDALESSARNQRWWNINGTATTELPLQQEQIVALQLEPGLHVIRVSAWWNGIGDVTYGFLLQAR